MKQIFLRFLAGAALILIQFLAPSPGWAQDPAACKTAKAAVTLDRKAVEKGVIKTAGTWEVSGGATGALVEVRVEADRWTSESFQGTKGTWDFVQAFKWEKCGHYGLRVYVYPSVDVNGHLYHCLDNDSSTPWHFDVACGAVPEILHCDWECGDREAGQCTGVCSGAASQGSPPYKPFWGVNDSNYQEGERSAGPWTGVVHCSKGDKVTFKVRDLNGIGRAAQIAQVDCGGQPAKP
jgi:hypothetical protein